MVEAGGEIGAIFAVKMTGGPENGPVAVEMTTGATKHFRWCFKRRTGILDTMRDGVKLAAGLVLSVTLAAGAQARINPAREGGASGPYRAITDRNIFGLLHIDTNVVAEPPLPPPNVNLIGLMQVSGNPQVVLAISEPGPGAKAPVSYIMGVDERQQGVDVLSIDLAGKTAKVQVGENISVLKLVEPKPVTTGVVVGALP